MTERSPKEAVVELTAGPVTVYPSVLRALSRPVRYDFDVYFQDFYETVNRKVTEALRCPGPALVLHAEPAVGLEAAAASLISRGDVVLNLVSGVYGKGFGYFSARHHKEMIEIEVPYNEAIDPVDVAAMIERRPDIAVVSLVHHDTPSGTVNPVNEIGEIVRRHGALFLVDAVSSFAGMDVHPTDCCADIFVTGPGKCLGGPPGLTIMAVSDRAWEKMEAHPARPEASILSLTDWKDAWSREEPFPFTPSVAEINGLDGAIDQYLQEGPENVWRRHALTARACRAGVKAMGCSLWPARDEIAADTTTAVRVPEGLSDVDIRAAARELCGVVFSGGRAETLGKLIRIGHMGPTAEPVYAAIAVTALGAGLRRLGFAADVGAGIEAAMAEIEQVGEGNPQGSGSADETARTVFSVGAGPPDLYAEVRAALTRPVPLDADPGFLAAYQRINEKTTRALRSPTPALILQSEAILGIEAAAASLIGRKDIVLNLASGPYSKGFGYWAARYCGELLEIEVPHDEVIDPARIEAMLRERPDIGIVAAVHHETPTGMLSPMREIGAVTRAHDALLIVDAVSSFGGMDVHAADIEADIFIAGPGKCLGGSPGLTIMTVSDRAWAHIDANPDAPFASILSLKDWRDAHLAEKPFPFTPLIAEINALEATIDRYLSEGPEAVWRRHALTARVCRAGARAMGLALWPRTEESASPSLTALRMPDGVDGEAVVNEAHRRYGVLLSPGTGDLAARLIRIGHMGPSAEPVYAVLALIALGGALRAQGCRVDPGAGVEAALAVIDEARPG